MNNEAIVNLIIVVGTFVVNQFEAFFIRGNKHYSISFMTHATFERKGLLKLIYFKPKHFGHYSIWEIIGFFFSYIALFVSLPIACVAIKNQEILKTSIVISFVLFTVSFAFHAIKTIYNEICIIKEENKEKRNNEKNQDNFEIQGLENSKIINSFFSYALSKRGRLEFLYQQEIDKVNKDDFESILKINKTFKKYFHDIDLIEIEGNEIFYNSSVTKQN